MVSQISPVIEQFLSDEQFGFRKSRSTIIAAVGLIRDIQEGLQKERGKIYVVFLDYVKAFDTVNQKILMAKLQRLSNTWTHRLISNILAENHLQISNNIDRSEWISQENGVLQGDPLSPILFNILTCDVVETIRKEVEDISMYIYTAMACRSRTQLQRAIDMLVEWADVNELEINLEKTELTGLQKRGKTSS